MLDKLVQQAIDRGYACVKEWRGPFEPPLYHVRQGNDWTPYEPWELEDYLNANSQ